MVFNTYTGEIKKRMVLIVPMRYIFKGKLKKNMNLIITTIQIITTMVLIITIG